MTKAQFAERMQRSRSCISGWIAAGKISGEALIGEGREARIWVERAEADLAASLDPSQQVAQPAPIMVSADHGQIGALDPITSTLRAPICPEHLSERERDLARRAKADADKAEHDAEAARRKLALDEGRYVLAEDAAAAWGRELSKLLGDVETFVRNTLPRALADKHALDWRLLSATAGEEWRAFRAQASDDARSRREAIESERDHA